MKLDTLEPFSAPAASDQDFQPANPPDASIQDTTKPISSDSEGGTDDFLKRRSSSLSTSKVISLLRKRRERESPIYQYGKKKFREFAVRAYNNIISFRDPKELLGTQLKMRR